MPDAELMSLIRRIDALEQIKLTQAQSIVDLHFGRPKQGPSTKTRDREADSDGASLSISIATVVLVLAAAAAVAASVVMVPITEGKTGEETSLIVTEGAEGDIDSSRELTGEGEYHVPRDRRCAYYDNRL